MNEVNKKHNQELEEEDKDLFLIIGAVVSVIVVIPGLAGFFTALLWPYFYSETAELRGNKAARSHPIKAEMEIDYRSGYESILVKFDNQGAKLSDCELKLGDRPGVPLERLTLYDPDGCGNLTGADSIPADTRRQIYFGISHSDTVARNLKAVGWEDKFDTRPFPRPKKVKLECRELAPGWVRLYQRPEAD